MSLINEALAQFNTFLFLHFYFSVFIVFILGAIIGSFLNVVIYRYPLMLKSQWREECQSLLEIKEGQASKKINLLFPRSFCPSCKKNIPWWCNIPIIGYILLFARCFHCCSRIPISYLLVECLSAVASVIVFLHFGPTFLFLEVLLLTYGLIVLSFIDIQDRILPDTITLSLLWLGLLVSRQHYFVSPEAAILGAVVGYLSLYFILQLYRILRKKDGMGLGDCKMLALFGAWLGWMPLPQLLLIAALMALVIAVILLLLKKIKKDYLIPFGPYLAISGWVLTVYGDQWMMLWLQTRMLLP
ncbi:MAG: hypothetical protein A3E84_00125 [Gammaproteobacteria bacterium RIFCSPHIGHO2_12_FULL_42_13]|nr:MAG: hypothetical protein A3E84_00125 [Gammaproteobacteria bacterium RIFCSPHIGHO2_12_FULL_42_13]